MGRRSWSRPSAVLGALNPGLGLAILRIVLGVIFLMHGWPKLAGGIDATAGFLGSLGLPFPLLAAWGLALLEAVGGLLLIIGYLVAPVAVLLTLHMTAGIFLVHLANGFYVVGPGQGGIEFNLLLISALLTVLFAGPGFGTLKSRLQRDITVSQ